MKPARQEARAAVRAPLRPLSMVALAISALIAGCASTFDGGAANAEGRDGQQAGPEGQAGQAGQEGQAGLERQEMMILSASSGRPIPPAEWTWQLRQAPVVLLGEVHDNRRHHELRARLLRIWAERADGGADRAGRPAIVFEFFDRQRRAGPPAHR